MAYFQRNVAVSQRMVINEEPKLDKVNPDAVKKNLKIVKIKTSTMMEMLIHLMSFYTKDVKLFQRQWVRKFLHLYEFLVKSSITEMDVQQNFKRIDDLRKAADAQKHLKGQMIELTKCDYYGKGDSELTKKLDKRQRNCLTRKEI